MTSTTTAAAITFDPYDAETAFHPYELFRRMRDEAPLYLNEELGFYALTRFEDVEATFLDRATFISGRGVTLDLLRSDYDIPKGTVIFEDPPTHAIHRALLSRMFTPRHVAGLEPQIRQLCADVLDPLVATGRLDFAVDIGRTVPVQVIGMLMGIPEEDRAKVRAHFDASRARASDDREGSLSGEIFTDYVDWRAANPSDDIMSQLMFTEFTDEDGIVRTLSREELLAYINIVTAAGNETTGMLMQWMGKVLSDHPDQRRLLVEDPSLVPNAIEEILRFEAPTLMTCRYVARDVEIHGQVVPEGSIMAMLNPAANRDERAFDDPDTFNVRRSSKTIFSFGFGSHYCLGQALARLEGRVVLEEVLKRFPDWELDDANATWGVRHSDMRPWASVPVVAT
jgi:cytochrome P450